MGEIFEEGGMVVQTLFDDWSVWCCTGVRLLELAHFSDLKDAIIYVDAVVQYERSLDLFDVYTILQEEYHG